MITKKILIEFANRKIKAVDNIKEIREAAKFAGLNLYSRHDVQLQYPMVTANDQVVVEIKIPDDKADSFSAGNHLRGISAYLLERYGERYRNYRVGNRLLIYAEMDGTENAPQTEHIKLSMTDRLEAVVSFAKLLERSDGESMDQIERIMVILKESGHQWDTIPENRKRKVE